MQLHIINCIELVTYIDCIGLMVFSHFVLEFSGSLAYIDAMVVAYNQS